jgi:hypothetical protein
MGWRYLVFTLGGVMLLLAFVRFFTFPLYESPRYLLGCGHDAEAVAVVHKIARYNGTESSVTIEDLERAARGAAQKEGADKWRILSESSVWTAKHVRALFATKKMAWSTGLLIWIWGIHFLFLRLSLYLIVIDLGLIGLAATLYNLNNFLPYLCVCVVHNLWVLPNKFFL